MGGDPIGNVLGLAEFGEGGPTGVDDVDKHEGFGRGGIDEDVAGFVVGALVGEMEGLVAEMDRFVFGEDRVGEWAGGVWG